MEGNPTMKNVRTLQENGETFVVLPILDYERLVEKNSHIIDAATFDAARKRNEESFPIVLFDAIDGGENPITVFRKHRGMTQKALSIKADISPAMLSQMEHGTRTGTIETLRNISEALAIPLDLIIS